MRSWKGDGERCLTLFLDFDRAGYRYRFYVYQENLYYEFRGPTNDADWIYIYHLLSTALKFFKIQLKFK